MRERIVEHTSYLWRDYITPIFHLVTEHLLGISRYRWYYLCHYISLALIAFSSGISYYWTDLTRYRESIPHYPFPRWDASGIEYPYPALSMEYDTARLTIPGHTIILATRSDLVHIAHDPLSICSEYFARSECIDIIGCWLHSDILTHTTDDLREFFGLLRVFWCEGFLVVRDDICLDSRVESPTLDILDSRSLLDQILSDRRNCRI